MIETNLIESASYGYFRLANNLKVVTISDPTIDKCSCSLSVGIGSVDEPVEISGLAHFLEHMLFMGTEKYPKENEFLNYLSKHNGYSNAFTCDEHTTYYFDVDCDAFEPGMDRFSSFFINPLFIRDAVSREISAVDSEFRNGLNSDDWRLHRLMQTMFKEGLAERCFNVGNSQTLKIPKIWEKVKKFWGDMYSSDMMCLVIYGNESSEVLKRYSLKFGAIPYGKNKVSRNRKIYGQSIRMQDMATSGCNNDSQSIERSTNGLLKLVHRFFVSGAIPFDAKYLNRIVYVKPIQNQKSLCVHIALPSEYHLFKANLYAYLLHKFGLESKGGFVYELKSLNLGFSASLSFESSTKHSIAMFVIQMTDEGFSSPTAVLKLLISYIRNFHLSEDYYNTLGFIYKSDFNYKEKPQPIDYASSITDAMLFYPIENVLNYSYVFEDYDEELFRYLLNEMADYERWLIMLVNEDGVFDRVEDVYKVEYRISDVKAVNDFDTEEEKSSDEKGNDPCKSDGSMEIGDLRESFLDGYISESRIKVINLPDESKMYNDEKGELRYVFTSAYKVPKCHINILLVNKGIIKDVVSYSAYVKLVEEAFYKLHDELLEKYQVNISFNSTLEGLEVHVSGFSLGIVEIAKLFVGQIYSPLDFSRYGIVKESIRNELLETIYSRPYTRVAEGLKKLVIPGFNLAEERLDLLDSLEVDNLEICTMIRMVVVGNIAYERVLDLYIYLKSFMGEYRNIAKYKDEANTTFDKAKLGCVGTIPGDQLSDIYSKHDKSDVRNSTNNCKGHNIVLRPIELDLTKRSNEIIIKDKENKASCIYYPIGKACNYKKVAIASLVVQITGEMFFDQLRTKEELGYVVSCNVTSISDTYFVYFLVQSSKPCEFLTDRISGFVESLGKVFKQLSMEDFEDYKNSVVSNYKERHKNLHSYSSYIWKHYLESGFDIHYKDKMAKVVQKLEIDDIINCGIFEAPIVINVHSSS